MSGPKQVHEITGHHSATVNGIYYIPSVNNQGSGIVSVGDDKQFIIFLLRDNGDYWPSVAEELPSAGTALYFDEDTAIAYIGLANGTILIYKVINDYNAFEPAATINGHSDRVTAIHVDKELKILISTSRDKSVKVRSLEDNKLLASYNTLGAWGTALDYDEKSPNIFVADYSGRIHVFKLDKKDLTKIKSVAVLEGHEGSIRSLLWDRKSGLLFSGSFDNSVKVWDIGACKGESYTLRGHTGKIKGIAYISGLKQLVTAGSDKKIVVWNLNQEKWKEDPEWQKSDVCQLCGEPFLWNIKKMWEDKKPSLNRQHHCRWSGKAVCATCSPHRMIIPEMGYEFKTRVSIEAEPKIEDKTPRAKAFPTTYEFLEMKLITLDNNELGVITCGSNGRITTWQIQSGLLNSSGTSTLEFDPTINESKTRKSSIAADSVRSFFTPASSSTASKKPEEVAAQAKVKEEEPKVTPQVYSTGADLTGPTKSLLDTLDDDSD